MPKILAACCGLVMAAAIASAKPPNIVLILSDDQAWTDYGFMGHETIQTPTIDRLARSGSLFRRGYVPTALCRPSLMTIVTGQYASVHGVTGNDPSFQQNGKTLGANDPQYRRLRQRLIDRIGKQNPLPMALSQAGYRSHQSGKWWEGNFANGGFNEGMTRGFPQRGGRHGDDGLDIGRETMQPIDTFVKTAADDEVPFFLWYAPFLPHSPHNPPAEILARYARPGVPDTIARYQAMCEWFDDTCGQLLEILDRHQQSENTMIVYVCDNGWIQRPDSPKFADRSKQSPYEGGVRTPIIYHWPSVIPASDRAELTSSIDIYPTILAAAGLPIPDGLPGMNLLPSLIDQTPIERKQIFGEAFAHDIADIDRADASRLFNWTIRDQWKLILSDDGLATRYADVHDRSNPAPQLYDLIADPTENHNVANNHPEITSQLSESIQAFQEQLAMEHQY